ncbi:MAG TPA: hypothetical protein VFV30_06455 [Novosphingobium sp.]|nr:hypothetical protein [Novosphingobium sp.]
MAYGYEDPDRDGLGLGAKIAIGLGVLVGLPLIAAFAYGIYVTLLMTPEQKFDRMLEAEPEARIFIDPLKKHYPEEYEDLRGSVLVALQGTNGELNGRLASMGFMNGFVVRHGYEAALAPDADLKPLLDAQTNAFAVFAANPNACESAIRQVPLADDKMKKQDKVTLIRFSGQFVKTAAAGRDRPVRRDRAGPEDQTALIEAMRAEGVSPSDLRDLDPAGGAREEAVRRCGVLHKTLRAVQKLPPERSVRIYALLLGSSR